jgi:hypothetical protein
MPNKCCGTCEFWPLKKENLTPTRRIKKELRLQCKWDMPESYVFPDCCSNRVGVYIFHSFTDKYDGTTCPCWQERKADEKHS